MRNLLLGEDCNSSGPDLLALRELMMVFDKIRVAEYHKCEVQVSRIGMLRSDNGKTSSITPSTLACKDNIVGPNVWKADCMIADYHQGDIKAIVPAFNPYGESLHLV
jgi:hypothetical protein